MEISEFPNISFEHPRGSTFKKYWSQDLAPVRFTNTNFNHRVWRTHVDEGGIKFSYFFYFLFLLLSTAIVYFQFKNKSNHLILPNFHFLWLKSLIFQTANQLEFWQRHLVSFFPCSHNASIQVMSPMDIATMTLIIKLVTLTVEIVANRIRISSIAVLANV